MSDNSKEPELTYTLISTDFINNYNEDIYIKQALEESLKDADEEYIAFQLEQIKNAEMNEIKLNEEKIDTDAILTLHLIEKLQQERNKSLENILYQFIKLKKIDLNLYENLKILEDIIKKYVNCEIDNYKMSLDMHENIFNHLQNIRIKETELKLIKKIIIIN